MNPDAQFRATFIAHPQDSSFDNVPPWYEQTFGENSGLGVYPAQDPNGAITGPPRKR